MRHLADFLTESAAQARCDFLEVKHIQTTLRQGKSFEVWVLEDDELEQARALLESFVESEDHAGQAQNLRQKREREARPVALPAQSRRPTSDSAGLLTIGLIVVSVVVAFLSKFGDLNVGIIRQLLVVPVFEVSGGSSSQMMAPIDLVWTEPWRLFTPMVIHFGIFHLVFNMMWLHLFGSQIESRHGPVPMLVLALVAQLLGSIAQFRLTGPFFGGMSGVNYALFGFVWMQSRYGTRGYGIEGRDTVLLMGWLLLCATGVVGPVANACHAIGLAVGLLAGLPAYLHATRSKQLRRDMHKGSWADLNIKGWQRFDRLYVQPFVPLWFMATALGVLLLDL